MKNIKNQKYTICKDGKLIDTRVRKTKEKLNSKIAYFGQSTPLRRRANVSMTGEEKLEEVRLINQAKELSKIYDENDVELFVKHHITLQEFLVTCNRASRRPDDAIDEPWIISEKDYFALKLVRTKYPLEWEKRVNSGACVSGQLAVWDAKKIDRLTI